MDDLPRVRAWRAAREGMPEPVGDGDYAFAGEIGDFPEEWVERTDKGERLRSSLRKFAPRSVQVDATGALGGSGRHGWLIPGKFRFCPSCRQQSSSRAREINKLAGLSGEGRSSATTLLVSSTLRWMNEAENGIAEGKRKLLGFTDNRQDAALQSGHFNDFLFVTLLRAAILAAVRSAGRKGSGRTSSAGRISFGSASSPVRCQAAGVVAAPETKGSTSRMPSGRWARCVLSCLGRQRAVALHQPEPQEHGSCLHYPALSAWPPTTTPLPAARTSWRRSPRETPQGAGRALRVSAAGAGRSTEAWNRGAETVARQSGQLLREPWAISERENLRLCNHPHDRSRRSGRKPICAARPDRARGRRAGTPGAQPGRYLGEPPQADRYRDVLAGLLRADESYALDPSACHGVRHDGEANSPPAGAAVPGRPRVRRSGRTPISVDLYAYLAYALGGTGEGLFGAGEAASTPPRSIWSGGCGAKWRFRFEKDDRKLIDENRQSCARARPDRSLPTLFCRPPWSSASTSGAQHV